MAIVIATKEILLSIFGGLVKSYSQSFKVGDRIDIDGFRGDVVNIDLFNTSLLEIGPGNKSHQYTGRSISLPNSLFLAKPVINETYTEDYILHIFSIPINAKSDWERAETIILEAAEETVREYLDEAKQHMEKLGNKSGFETPNVEPRITISITDPEVINLLIRVPVPSRRKGKVEQAIIRQFLKKNWKTHKEEDHGGKESKIDENNRSE